MIQTNELMKYGNKKVKIDGYTFDSQLEASRFLELKLLLRAGLIRDLQLQPSFELIPSFEKNGKKYRRVVYKADFAYFDIGKGKTIIEDTKGFRTKEFIIKKKLFEYNYPKLEIVEISKEGQQWSSKTKTI